MIMTKIIKKLGERLSFLQPYQVIILGFLFYVAIGTMLISLPFAQKHYVNTIDNLFNVVSAMSTTGLTTGALSEMYTPFGKLILLGLIQLGAIGYMTITSFFILSSGQKLSSYRTKILSAEFTLPQEFNIKQFIRNIIIYTFTVELIGTLLLAYQFHSLGLSKCLWSGVFHAVSAFSTAGFSIYNNGLENFRDHLGINMIIAILCYAGSIGFIIPMDIYRKVTGQSREITLTTKVILMITAIVAIFGTIFYLVSGETHLLSAFFQVMSASTTAGFNTVPVGNLKSGALLILIIAMVIGASPSGTGGGIKTTSISVLYGIVASVMRGQTQNITFMKKNIPYSRIFTAVAASATYITLLMTSIYLLTLTESFSFLELSFETASALGTVGLSMGITSSLSAWGKLILTLTMFLGRVGPLTLGIAFFKSESKVIPCKSDLAT